MLRARTPAQALASTLRCYWEMQSMNVRSRLSYARDTWLESLLFMIQQFAGLMLLWVIFTRVRTIAGWSLPEMAFLYALQILSMSLYRLMFQGVRDTTALVAQGTFDMILTKPRHPLLLLTCRRSNTNGLADLVFGIAVLLSASARMDFVWTVERVLLLFLFVVSANVLIIGLMTAQAAISFWLIRFTALHDIIMAVREFTFYPLSIYGAGIRILMYTAIPLAFASYIPAAVLLGKDDIPFEWWIAPPLVALACLMGAIGVFQLGLRSYKSTGS